MASRAGPQGRLQPEDRKRFPGLRITSQTKLVHVRPDADCDPAPDLPGRPGIPWPSKIVQTRR
jgi:hypothetical protein